ncbi:TetR family transcriptional regulator [Nocardia ignorata]|uniref:TetR family transcriptional regulator n=1 Tax=Nocardia ignorata TaxID=145285 RepID=A0A4R6PP36_NOCIG|nr:TetR family transcriptional regulator [Nocardia ignorata]TDP39898.1 TetR family transcriptional regulator [Nocardia ignorata]
MLDSTTPTASDRPAPPSLRERKKAQTRAAIVAIGLDLCDTQGFDATTVEQIAAGADVSPRTVNRYFALKEDIVLAPIDDFGHAVAVALRGQPDTGNELRALCGAYLQVVESEADADGLRFLHQFLQTQRIMRASQAVNARALEYAEKKNVAVCEELARRMGTTPDDFLVKLVAGTWQTLCHLAVADTEHVLPTSPEAAVRVTREAILRAYHGLRQVCGAPADDTPGFAAPAAR